MLIVVERSPALRIVTSVARESLKPLGLVPRGRSRLWHDVDHLAFHVEAVRVGAELFRTEDQFTPPALELGRQAAANVTVLREKFPSPQDVARYLTPRPARRGFLWDGFDSGIAAALVGDPDTARDHCERVLREDVPAPWMVEAQEKACELHAIAAAWVTWAVGSCRSKLGLDPVPLAIS